MRYFSYENVAAKAHIPHEKLEILCRQIRLEFPHDDMLYELHVLRVCMAVRDGMAQLDEILSSESVDHAI